MLILGNTAYVTTKSSQRCFLGAQKGKHLLRKQNVFEKMRNIFCFSFVSFVQPFFIAFIITLFLDEVSPTACALQVFTRAATAGVINASLFHIASISGERYVAVKHCFTHSSLITDARLVVVSALTWLLSVSLQILRLVHINVFHTINNIFIVLFIVFIVFCLVAVYYEIADMNSILQLNKLHKRQGNNWKITKRRLN